MKRVRQRTKRLRMPVKAARNFSYSIRPNERMPFVVRVHISPTRAHMRMTFKFKEGMQKLCENTGGSVQSYYSKVDGRPVVRPGFVIANMYLNRFDLKRNPTEIIAHECVHAGMAWATLRKETLKKMASEEVLAYATGDMTRQVTAICYATGVFNSKN